MQKAELLDSHRWVALERDPQLLTESIMEKQKEHEPPSGLHPQVREGSNRCIFYFWNVRRVLVRRR